MDQKDLPANTIHDRFKSTLNRILLIISLAVFLGAILANAYVGFFSRYVADDYCTAGILRANGFWDAQRFWYVSWSGRYAFTFVVTFVELFGTRIVPVLPLLAQGIWLLIAVWTLTQLKKLAGLEFSLPVSVLLAAIFIFGMLNGTPDIPQSLFWQTGMLTYTAPLIILTCLAGFIALAIHHKAAILPAFFLCAGLSFFAGGFSETNVAFQTSAFGLAIALSALLVRAPQRVRVISILAAGFAGSFLAMLVMILAPGNAVRLGLSPQPPGIISIINTSILYGQNFIVQYVPVSKRLLITLFFLPLLVSYLLPPGRINRTGPGHLHKILLLMGLIPFFSFILIVSCFASSVYGESASLPPRALEIPWFVLVLALIFEGYLLGLLAKSSKIAGRFETWQPSTLVLGLITLALLVAGPLSSIKRTLDFAPAMISFASGWDKQDRQIRSMIQAGEENPKVSLLANPFDLENMSHLESDPSVWINQCVGWYYDLNSIYTK